MGSEKSLVMYFISWFHISRIVENVTFVFCNLFEMGSKSETSLNYQKVLMNISQLLLSILMYKNDIFIHITLYKSFSSLMTQVLIIDFYLWYFV